jgi:hypothetical protein
MKAQLYILAHDGTEKTIAEFKPYWRRIDDDFTIITPEGSKYPNGLQAGPSAYKGKDILLRFWLTLKTIAKDFDDSEETRIIIAEYDTLPMNGKNPHFNPSAINAPCVMLVEPDGTPQPQQLCMLSPWVVSPAMLQALIYATDPHRYEVADWTLGLLDRMIGDCCVKAGLPLGDIRNAVGYAPGEDDLRFARAVAARNADWVHGGKSLAEFNLNLPT